jgi:sugar lactone lactonase YvrE
MKTVSSSTITGVQPLWGVEGGRITLSGRGFEVDPELPEVTFAGVAARIATATSSALSVIVPPGLEGGRTPVRVSSAQGETAYVEIGAPVAAGVHQVDNPVFDRDGNLFVTYSGTRGQQAPVSIYVVKPDGSREPFVTNVPNPTSMAMDAEGTLFVSSRFDGSVYRVSRDGTARSFAEDLGVPCGIAFDANGRLYVGDRSGSILRVHEGEVTLFASIPSSVAAFHLAFGPDDCLYVSSPSLASRDVIYRVTSEGVVEVFGDGFGRPQGLAFDADGTLYIVDAIAGDSAVYRVELSRPAEKQRVIVGGGLIGLAFDPRGGLALASGDTVYRLASDLRPLQRG